MVRPYVSRAYVSSLINMEDFLQCVKFYTYVIFKWTSSRFPDPRRTFVEYMVEYI